MDNPVNQPNPDEQSSVSATPNNINTETLSLSELLDFRYSLPADERNAVKANRVIAGDPKKMFMWSFHCIYQDRPVLVILAGTVLLYHVFKLGVAAVSAVL